jgi:hypothetical protein
VLRTLENRTLRWYGHAEQMKEEKLPKIRYIGRHMEKEEEDKKEKEKKKNWIHPNQDGFQSVVL